MQSMTLSKQTLKMQLLQSQSGAWAAQGRLASHSLVGSAAGVGLESSNSVGQCMLLAVSGGGHS